jgi:hydrogenase small subunit
MGISRRDFLKYCGVSAAVLGLSSTDLLRLKELLANPSAPTVLWLQGAGCTGCSISFLNRISSTSPTTAADVLVNSINLTYHPNLMALAGQPAVEVVKQAYDAGGYILAVEGGVPTAFGGHACLAWTYNGEDVTFQQAVLDLSSRAAKIISIGNCSAWGGIPAAQPNPTKIKGIQALTGLTTVNIAGCPPHPDWIVWAVAQLLLGNNISLDLSGRPTTIFNKTVHDQCPRKELDKTNTFGVVACLRNLGCRGPGTKAPCPNQLWNNQSSWCVDGNAPCLGCTEPDFPGTQPFYQHV